jgi:hypothetical protein
MKLCAENDFRRRQDQMRDDVEINSYVCSKHGQKKQESDKYHHAVGFQSREGLGQKARE